jgi:hypothetical protein
VPIIITNSYDVILIIIFGYSAPITCAVANKGEEEPQSKTKVTYEVFMIPLTDRYPSRIRMLAVVILDGQNNTIVSDRTCDVSIEVVSTLRKPCFHAHFLQDPLFLH